MDAERPLVFRCDDVTAQTNPRFMNDIREFLNEKFPGCRFILAVNLYSQRNAEGSVYPGAPFKNQPLDFFMNVDMQFTKPPLMGDFILASHGMLHVDHSKLTYDAQLISIVPSCRYLRTKIFVPPFNRFNEDTDKVCKTFGVHLVKPEEGWKSIEHERFDPSNRLWYFHHWKYKTLEDFAKKLGMKAEPAQVASVEPEWHEREDNAEGEEDAG